MLGRDVLFSPLGDVWVVRGGEQEIGGVHFDQRL